MTDFIKPVFDDECFGPPKGTAPEGDYQVKILAEPFLKQGQSGNRYLGLFLGFADPELNKKYNAFNSIVMLEGTTSFTDEETGETKTRSLTWRLAGLLKAIGLTAKQIKSFQFSGNVGEKAVLSVDNEIFSLEGREVIAHLTESEYKDKMRNDVRYYKRLS